MLQQDTRARVAYRQSCRPRPRELASFTSAIGQPDEERSISSQIAKLAQAFQSLGESPENAVVQHSVIGAAQGVAHSLNQLATAVGEQRKAADQGISDSVASINQSLDDLANINKQLSTVGGSGRDVTDLLDQRDKLLDSLSSELGITSLNRATPDHGADPGRERPSSTAPRSIICLLDHDHDRAASAYKRRGRPLSGVTVNGLDISPAAVYAGAIRSGRLVGEFALRDTILPQAQASSTSSASRWPMASSTPTPPSAPARAALFTDAGRRP